MKPEERKMITTTNLNKLKRISTHKDRSIREELKS